MQYALSCIGVAVCSRDPYAQVTGEKCIAATRLGRMQYAPTPNCGGFYGPGQSVADDAPGAAETARARPFIHLTLSLSPAYTVSHRARRGRSYYFMGTETGGIMDRIGP